MENRGGMTGFTGYKHTEEVKAKFKLRGKGHYKKVEQLNDDATVVKLWDSIKDAANVLGIAAPHISRVCKGKRKHTGGFKWRYYGVH